MYSWLESWTFCLGKSSQFFIFLRLGAASLSPGKDHEHLSVRAGNNLAVILHTPLHFLKRKVSQEKWCNLLKVTQPLTKYRFNCSLFWHSTGRELWASTSTTRFSPPNQALITEVFHLSSFFKRCSWHKVFINIVKLNEEHYKHPRTRLSNCFNYQRNAVCVFSSAPFIMFLDPHCRLNWCQEFPNRQMCVHACPLGLELISLTKHQFLNWPHDY